MLKYLSKFFLEILPSVVATVVGAYIVNHYINPPRTNPAEAPRAAAISRTDSQPGASAAVTTKVEPAPSRPETAKVESKSDAKPKAVAKTPAEPTRENGRETAKADTAKPETEGRRFVSREKAPDRPAPSETTAAPAAADDHPDAAELARAALERLRAAEPAPRAAELPVPAVAAREATPAHVNVVTAVPTAAPAVDGRPAVPPLPPPVSVATPVERGLTATASTDSPRMARSAEGERLVPPADIPEAMPVDLHAPAAKKKSVADDMISAARSVFQSVVPQ